MDENIVFDAAERYANGAMGDEERKLFEELRRQNPEVDQLVANHLFITGKLKRMADLKQFKARLNEAEIELENEGVLANKSRKTSARLVYLWNRYRRTITVAAAIAVLVSISTATFVSLVQENKKVATITPLVDNKLNQFERKLHQIETKLREDSTGIAQPKFEANFRATGFLIDASGFIVTNAHVVNSARNLVVENKAGAQFAAKALYNNPLNDLAILQITDSSFTKESTVPYVFSKQVADLAEAVFTLGYPREEIVYGQGYISAKSGYFGDTASYQISISVNPGNSGGPLLNKHGEVIGIITSKEANADGVVFAVKSEGITQAIAQIREAMDIQIKTPVSNDLRGLERVQQIRKLQECVFKVKGN